MSQSARFESNTAFINYPKQAVFGRTLPKNKIYEHSGANTRLKDLFVEQVEQIVWQYKLAPETINLPARPGVPELQIFSIQLKTLELNMDVLRCIDGAVQFPVIFELSFDERTKVIAAYKRPNESDASRWVLSDYFATAWLSSDYERATMPLALDLGSLYEQVLHRLIPMPARPQETLADLVSRVELVAAKQREVEKAASRLAKEKQFNRKVEINAHLRRLKNELEELTGRESA
ncbi:DUF4391 domain-containing protein [Klebsiella quasipneumoniae]|jgi:hypothetical protein|uniref:DUF4391 domain-containing protein n=1 Tax=Klebsiella quasipneumoniae subsp. similipneumoniae TaxID=1463164 RepID=A0AAE4MTZ3_9ENTR|nr:MULTISPECIES: DUF4391 domain-containing protein [Enterobacteriaceae]MBY8385766.1 DUF4391 domain-containing protein [Klebsiella quasipneumoniae]MCD9963094.1 DUF4391 domain-containing protein [Klebsiella quasipneumoniae subsp. similipneumoniae]MCE0026667.1 DUF4391 domain-containing protein [Klebsiella quasipneumoniae subsp. similipneumoniae]MDL5482082.1 DUF4391 domain-containing protein [Klebsiella quasipneumoniae]MDR4607239.1 DUF4391 domain-containing protein [Klebsiella quasipneumoniae]